MLNIIKYAKYVQETKSISIEILRCLLLSFSFLQLDVQEVEEKLKEEKEEHLTTRKDVKNAMAMFNAKLKENQQLQVEMEECKHHMQHAQNLALQLQEDKRQLQWELDEVVQQLATTISIDVPDGDEKEGSKQEIIDVMEEQLRELEEKAKSQECDIVAMNKKILAIMGKESTDENTNDNKMEEMVKNLDELLKDYVEKHNMVEEAADTNKNVTTEVIHESTHKSKPKVSAKLLATLKAMKKKMSQMNEEWEDERHEMQYKLKNMQTSLKAKMWEVRKLEDQMVYYGSPPCTPISRRGSQDTTASGFTGISLTVPIPIKSFNSDGLLSLPQLTYNQSMVSSNCNTSSQNQGDLRGDTYYPQTLNRSQKNVSKSCPGPIQAPVSTCVQCQELVSEDDVNMTKCRYHKRNFHTKSQMWSCCRLPKSHPGCVVNIHKVKK